MLQHLIPKTQNICLFPQVLCPQDFQGNFHSSEVYICADLISDLTPGPPGHEIQKKTARSQTGQWMHES